MSWTGISLAEDFGFGHETRIIVIACHFHLLCGENVNITPNENKTNPSATTFVSRLNNVQFRNNHIEDFTCHFENTVERFWTRETFWFHLKG